LLKLTRLIVGVDSSDSIKMFWILIALIAVILGYYKLIYPHSYWTRKGVVQTKPVFLFGHTWKAIFRRISAPELTDHLYNLTPNARYCGIYQFLLPTLLVRDPDLIKQMLVKDFDHFVDHRGFVPTETDPLLGKSLFSLLGIKWREMRSTLSPSFTSSKMKYLFSMVSQSGEQFVKHFQEQDKDVVTVEMRDVITKFTNDVIANSVFGFDCNSLKEPNNQFYVMGKEATDFTSFRKLFVFMGTIVIPQFLRLFRISFFSDKMITFFTKIVKENIYSREKLGVVRPDMINLLLQARKPNFKYEQSQSLPDTGFATVEESDIGKNQNFATRKITDEDIAAQAFLFFFAGFDSVSSLLCFMSHELAVNQDVQEKLIQEVDDTWNECDGKITYEALMSMKYMDMVVSESLRKWPNAIATDRVCTKPYTIEPKAPNEKPLRLDVKDNIIIPIYSLHRDPQYYPDPDRFDPERFSDENKSKINPYTYLPFGTGPRSCIGSRFALMETKVLFFHLLSNFEIVPVAKTQIPIRFDRKAINMSAEKGFWVGLQRRKMKT
jgi:cytochrome P450 family 9